MTRGRIMLLAVVVLVLAGGVATWVTLSRTRQERRNTAELQAQIATLTTERDRLRAQVIAAVNMDPQLAGMPAQQLRIGVPTTLAHRLVSTFVSGVAEHVTLELDNLRVRREGSVRRLVTLGDYTLDVRITRVTAQLSAGAPDLRFGGDRVHLALPVRVDSGSGSAEIDFVWDGRTIGGAVCGDMRMREVVTGTVMPATYPLSGALQLSTTATAIVLTPRLPSLIVKIRVQPSKASWEGLQKVLDDKRGMCGFVIDRVNIRETLEELFAKGFDVRLPIERVKPLSLPVGIAQTMEVRDTPVTVDATGGDLTITPRMIWLGVNVTLTLPKAAAAARQ